ncbi:hypothetical protein [Myxococcus virescens]|uniref:Lipoprotein n=1 Tax=Myxococcus virescens TaxID=83456 RepID=A0A511HCF0_9BACT|nr:hypothetical protein [Myxococcus virescens]GEL71145.1 hypothetical protein MVI01_29290 [Myxococcus virescens]SDD87760.1 hypothetical protein SAMN04488504_10352 [Myxococcus virescens]
MLTPLPRTVTAVACSLFLSLGLTACGDDELNSDEQARRAYLGLDPSVGKALQLGFAGFNSASTANIPPQSTTGAVSGTLLVTGQVDQGSSANKGMRLRIGMTGYSDGEIILGGDEDPVNITYTSSTDTAAQPEFTLQLRGIPDGTFTGTLKGPFQMTGDLEGSVTLDLALTGEIEPDGTGQVLRTMGSTHVTGTATSSDGVYTVDVTL